MLEFGNVYVKTARGRWLINVEDSPEYRAISVETRDKALYLGRSLAQIWKVIFKIYDITGELVSEEDYRNCL